MPENKSFRESFSILKRTYNSIDLRGIVAYSYDEKIWRCIYLKINFTKIATSDLKRYYQKKYQLYPEIDYNDFKVIFEAKKNRRSRTNT